MITIEKYYDFIKEHKVFRKDLGKTLQKGWDYVNEVTKKGTSLDTYKKSEIVKRTIDLYLEKLETFLKSKKKISSMKKGGEGSTLPTKKTVSVKPKKEVPNSKNGASKKAKVKRRATDQTKTRKVEKLSIELKFIRRFVNLHDNAKTKNEIRLFLNALQRSIVQKEIKKTSKFAKEIEDIQNRLIRLMDAYQGDDIFKVALPQRLRGKLLAILGRQEELESVKLIKSYVRLQGQTIGVQKAKNLYNRIARKVNSGSITTKDRYWNEIEKALFNLKRFVKENPLGGQIQIEKRELNGLKGIFNGMSSGLSGLSKVPDKTIMNSLDVVKLNFEKLGFSGKWFDLIGNPSKDFTAMIYGKPKMGKSYMAVDFAGYLARNHGTVLYVAKEEGIDDTLQEKLKDKKVAHPDLDTSNYLPDDLRRYDFVFLDSVTKLGLQPEDLEALKAKHPGKSFIYIFQTTKQGNFRGNNEFQHDVDVVIEVPEKGRAVQFGRFNQGGEMRIFED